MNPKINDVLALVRYFKVIKTQAGVIDCQGLVNNMVFHIKGQPLIDQCVSADEVKATVKDNRTNVVRQMLAAGYRPFTAVFVKRDGSERRMRCHLLNSDREDGRSQVFDLDNGGLRLVDHRTIKELILNGTRYIINA